MSDHSRESTLNHYRHQARQLLRALQEGQQDAAARIGQYLPRLSGEDGATILAADVGLQEAQHVIAREAGYSKWADLTAAADEDIAALRYLSDADLSVLIAEVSIADLALALAGLASGPISHQHEAVFGLLRQMPAEVRRDVQRRAKTLVENQALIDEAWKRIALQAKLLAEDGRIHPGRREPFGLDEEAADQDPATHAPSSGPVSPPVDAAIEALRAPPELLAPEQIRAGLRVLAAAGRGGELEAAIPADAQGIVWQGLRLLVDGTEPPLIRDILESHVKTALRQLDVRMSLVTEAVCAIGFGDNPRIVMLKLLPIYRTQGPASLREPEGTVELALARLAAQPSTEMDLDELTLFLTDLAWVARRQHALDGDGLAPFGTVADAVDDVFLAGALRRLAELGQKGGNLHEAVHGMMQALVAQMPVQHEQAQNRYRLLVAGLMAICEGADEAQFEAALS